LEFLIMQRPPSVLVIALVSAVSGLVFLANSFTGNSNNWLTSSLSNSSDDSQGLLPIANALKKDLMLDVSPQLHPSTVVGESAKELKFQHWIDNDIHCEDCLRLEIPNNGKKAGAAFSSDGAVYNFEGAKKMRFYVMGEEPGAKVNFKAVGNDKAKTTGGKAVNNSSNNKNGAANNDLFKDQEFALTSQNVTLNQTWGYHEMSLEGAQQKLSKVKYPFALEVEQGKGKTTTIIYVKGIEYSDEPVQDQFLLAPSSSNTTASTLEMTAATTTPLNITLRDNATETVNAPATVEFNTTVSNGQEPYSFDWDFKDGAKEADNDGNIIHTFATPGLYNVTVNVVDSMNNTGSASTVLDVADQIVEDQPAVSSGEDNSTQDSQPAEVADIDNTTQASTGADNETEGANASNGNNSTTAAGEEPSGLIEGTNADDDSSTNDTETNTTNTGTGIDTQSNSATNNSPPIANAGNDLIGKPNGQVILDASKSSDPDAGDAIVSYQWEQKSGPAAEINDQASPTPIVTLPDVDEDSTIVFSLTVNDGSIDSEEEDTVSIFVDHVDALANDVQQRVLKPADIITSKWIPSGNCEGQAGAECLSDGSDGTFVAAGTDGIDSVNLYSFGEFSQQEEGAAAAPIDPNSVVIDRVVAEITAKKIGNTGYVSFAVDDPRDQEHYFTPSLSIASSSFQKYNYVWDTNPVTGEIWTYDSLNSLVAGFKYDGGQSGVQVSELQLTVSYHSPAPEPAPVTEPAPSNGQDTTGDASNNVANEDEENDGSSTNDVQDTEQEEPAIEADNTDGNTADANDTNGEDSSESEE
jgi:hypothetical protein